MFEEHKGLDDHAQIERCIERGEMMLKEYAHPDPYIGRWNFL